MSYLLKEENMQISLCMIVRDEEETIGRCLECVKDVVDEIIIVDTGSIDHTKDIVKKYTDLLYDFKWCDHFSIARNYAFSLASKEYIMWLDADDVIDKENIEKLRKLKENLSSDKDVVMMKYKMGRESDFVFYRERIVKRSKGYKWVGTVHEYIEVSGNIYDSDITIVHQKEKVNDPDRNLKIYEKLIREGKKLSTRELFYYARELYEHEIYEKAITYFLEFLKREDAWIENKIEACLNMSTCYRRLGDDYKALQVLLHSFLYDTPRSELLCEIGCIFLERDCLNQAIYWYKKALENNINETKGGFIRKDCYDFIPYIQLCVCYDRLGDRHKAEMYNELAGRLKPNHSSYLYNQKYFTKKQRD